MNPQCYLFCAFNIFLFFCGSTEGWTTATLLRKAKTSSKLFLSAAVPQQESQQSGDTSFEQTSVATPAITTPTSLDTSYYNVPPNIEPELGNSKQRITLTRFLSNVVKENPQLRDMESLLLAIQMACKTISNLVNRAGLMTDEYYDDEDRGNDADDGTTNLLYESDGRFYSMKRLDQLSTIVLRNALQFTGKCECIAPESILDAETPADHQPGVLIANDFDSNYIAVLDPLDGSGNADASICTGTVFGVYEQNNESADDEDLDSNNENVKEEKLVEAVLQPAKNMRAAGYCLYSSSTVLVISLSKDEIRSGSGDSDVCGVYGFTLDPQIQDFVLTHRDLTIPKRGNVYSCNEANYDGWSNNFQDYLTKIKIGEGETGLKYAHRYVGSMVGDIHRTLLYGGIFCYPSDTIGHPDGNLQLLYKTAPMAYIISNAGGKAVNEQTTDLLNIKPERVHQKSPCFIGSPEDVQEVQKYLLNLHQEDFDDNEIDKDSAP